MVTHAGGGGKRQGGANHPINKVVGQKFASFKGLTPTKKVKQIRRGHGKAKFIESTANS